MIPWSPVLLALVLVLVGVGLLIALLIWRRRRAKVAKVAVNGPSTRSRLREIWSEFYANLSDHASQFPTFVVVGDTGAGKSTLIDHLVDWRSQAHGDVSPPGDDTLLQLYLGPDLIVHELSAALLRDDSPASKRALQQLWREIGSTATVVLVLDATTLIDMDRQARRELAQLLRAKLGLLPDRVRAQLEVRLYISKLDLIPGYLNFAATLGSNHPALVLSHEHGSLSDAAKLVESFDAHLTYALVHHGGADFDRLVSFYDHLPKLIGALEPILTVLEAKDQLFGASYPVRKLYLGSQVPHSHIGDPFRVNRRHVEQSITLRQDRHRRAAIALASVLLAGITGLTGWHGAQVEQARRAVVAFELSQDHDPSANRVEQAAAGVVVGAIAKMYDSQWLWMRWAFLPAKAHVDIGFEHTIYTHYLEPRFATTSRIELIYLSSVILSARQSSLADLISEHSQFWVNELGLDPWVLSTYLNTSRYQRERTPPLPEDIDNPGEEWRRYLLGLSDKLGSPRLTLEQFEELQKQMPKLRSPQEYEVLNKVRTEMLARPNLPGDVSLLLREELTPWGDYEELTTLRKAILDVDVYAGDTSGWGLAKLVEQLGRTPSKTPPFNVKLTQGSETVEITSAKLDALVTRSHRHELIAAVLDHIDPEQYQGGREFFSSGTRANDQGIVVGYGGGPRERIEGIYTKNSFEREVKATLEFANANLIQGSAQKLVLIDEDRRKLERAIRAAATAYATAYQQELISYFHSFEFDPGSEVALPHAIKPFSQPNSWFTKFLLSLSRNVALEFPAEDPGALFEDQRAAIEPFAPLAKLLTEEAGQIPGLAPYQDLVAALHKDIAGAVGKAGDPKATDLVGRLSTLGAFALGVESGINQDYEDLITDWLFGAGVEPEWYGPFLAPVQQVERYGLLDVEATVATAWKTNVRPIALPLLARYPFNPSAKHEVEPDELDEVFRMQGEIPGAFWDAFNRLIRPAMQEGRIAMVSGVRAPGGMLAMARDLERLSSSLWDDKGERVELVLEIEFALLPMEPFQDRYPAIASLSSGGGSVYGFNQKPVAQSLRYKWWEQGMSAVTVTMQRPELDAEIAASPKHSARYRLTADGEFSLFHLLDAARGLSLSTRKNSLTEIAMYRATRCDRQGPQPTRRTRIAWPVPLGHDGASTLELVVTILNDPWQPFAIRSCQ